MLLSGNFDLNIIIPWLIAIVIALVFHEVAHGFVAFLMGDHTAKEQGRLSLNPLRHIDPIGFLCMALIGFGWAKPVVFNPDNIKNKRDGYALIALAGPLSNFILGILGMAILSVVGYDNIPYFLGNFLFLFVLANMILAAFNILPFPVLDGFKVVTRILPDGMFYKALEFERKFGVYVLLFLILTQAVRYIYYPILVLLIRIGAMITHFPPDLVNRVLGIN